MSMSMLATFYPSESPAFFARIELVRILEIYQPHEPVIGQEIMAWLCMALSTRHS